MSIHVDSLTIINYWRQPRPQSNFLPPSYSQKMRWDEVAIDHKLTIIAII